MKEITLEGKQLRYAKKMADKKEALYTDPNGNPNGISEPDRFFTGIKGELAFLKLMMDTHCKVVWQYHELDKKAPPEFLLFQDKKQLLIDVKSSSGFSPEGVPHKFMMVPEVAFQAETDVDYYVGVRFKGDFVAEIYGYISRKDLGEIAPKLKPAKVLSRMILLTSLEPIGELINMVDFGKAWMHDVGTGIKTELGNDTKTY